jgi:hypothetical protein
MNRRQVLVRLGGVLLAIPASHILMACGSSDNGTQGLQFTSSNELGHTHTVTLQLTDLTNPPAAGVTKDTSVDMAHMHQVSLTEAELESIELGNSVTKITTNNDNHTHTFTFHK